MYALLFKETKEGNNCWQHISDDIRSKTENLKELKVKVTDDEQIGGLKLALESITLKDLKGLYESGQ